MNFRAITLIVLRGGGTNNQLLPFLHFQEPSAKSPSRDSRPYSLSSFSPLLCHAVPWNEAKRRGKQWKTSKHPWRAQSCASKHPFGDHLAVLGLLVPQCCTLWKDASRSTHILEIHCTSFLKILGSPFSHIWTVQQLSLPRKKKENTWTSPWRSTRSLQIKGESPCSLPGPQQSSCSSAFPWGERWTLGRPSTSCQAGEVTL